MPPCSGCGKNRRLSEIKLSRTDDTVQSCDSCIKNYEKDWYCSHCKRVYKDTSEDKNWIGCDICESWVCARKAGLRANSREPFFCVDCYPRYGKNKKASSKRKRKGPELPPTLDLAKCSGLTEREIKQLKKADTELRANANTLSIMDQEISLLETKDDDDPSFSSVWQTTREKFVKASERIQNVKIEST